VLHALGKEQEVAVGKAETIAKYLSKGKPLYVAGRLKLDQWDDKESGQKRSKMKVVLESFQFIGVKEDAAQGGEPQQEQRPPAQQQDRQGNSLPPPRRQAMPPLQEVDEDVPFNLAREGRA